MVSQKFIVLMLAQLHVASAGREGSRTCSAVKSRTLGLDVPNDNQKMMSSSFDQEAQAVSQASSDIYRTSDTVGKESPSAAQPVAAFTKVLPPDDQALLAKDASSKTELLDSSNLATSFLQVSEQPAEEVPGLSPTGTPTDLPTALPTKDPTEFPTEVTAPRGGKQEPTEFPTEATVDHQLGETAGASSPSAQVEASAPFSRDSTWEAASFIEVGESSLPVVSPSKLKMKGRSGKLIGKAKIGNGKLEAAPFIDDSPASMDSPEVGETSIPVLPKTKGKSGKMMERQNVRQQILSMGLKEAPSPPKTGGPR